MDKKQKIKSSEYSAELFNNYKKATKKFIELNTNKIMEDKLRPDIIIIGAMFYALNSFIKTVLDNSVSDENNKDKFLKSIENSFSKSIAELKGNK